MLRNAWPVDTVVGRHDSGNVFTARLLNCRYQGTQVVYDSELFGRRRKVLELGRAARRAIGVDMSICRFAFAAGWAYRDNRARVIARDQCKLLKRGDRAREHPAPPGWLDDPISRFDVQYCET